MKKLLVLDSPMDCPHRDNSYCRKLPMITLPNGEKEGYGCYGGKFPQHCPLPDAEVILSVEEVRSHYANVYPDLLNSTVKGPTEDGGKKVYTFNISTGTKG